MQAALICWAALLCAWVLTPPVATAASGPVACPEERDLCVQAERSGGIDLKSGVAHLEGNVQGLMRSRALRFSGQSLKAYRKDGRKWARLVIEGAVRLALPNRETASDRGVLEGNRIRLDGNVRIREEQLEIEGQQALLESEPNRTVVRGTPDQPLHITLQRALIPAGGARPGAPRADPAVRTLVWARNAEFSEEENTIQLDGEVRIEQSDGNLELKAARVMLRFGEDSALTSFEAGGGVEITQPERRISANRVRSRDHLETLLLTGNAVIRQAGQFDLKSGRLEVHTDSSKGLVQSGDRKRPITMSLDLDRKRTHRLTRQHLSRLAQQGVPPATLAKLEPVLGKKFPGRKPFEAALRLRLTAEEAERHLPLILKTVLGS